MEFTGLLPYRCYLLGKDKTFMSGAHLEYPTKAFLGYVLISGGKKYPIVILE
jgi:hypothetical protein